MPEYTIHGGDAGKKRLEILSRTLARSTGQFLQTAHFQPGMRILDLGCGGGEVTLNIAKKVGPAGQVTGLDLDARKIQLATEAAAREGLQNVEFKVFDAYDLQEVAAFDLIYTRFLLSHLSQPQLVLQKIRTALKPQGQLLAEDTDFSGHFCYPPADAFHRYVSLYQQLLKKRGADANLGQKLAVLLQEAGFAGVDIQVSQPVHTEGEGKLMAEITWAGISGALLEEGLATAEEIAAVQAGLVAFRERNDTLMSLPRIVQLSGRRS